MQSSIGNLIAGGLAVLWAAAISEPAAAQDATLPPSVQANIERGVVMARQSQWPLAIRYFRSAHEEAPDNPAALLNLGLAYDRMGGREIVAIPWFRAFLAAAPNAPNAAQVRARVAELDTALEVRIQQILDVAARVVDELPSQQDKATLISWLIRGHAEFGDLNGAQRAAARLPSRTGAGWGAAHIAALHGRRGNIIAAQAEAKQINSPAMRSWALVEIAVEQAKRRDFAGAALTAADIQVPREASFAWSRIALLQARAGDAAAAESALKRIHEAEAGPRAIALAATAVAFARIGDQTGASRLIVEADDLRQAIETSTDRMQAQGMLAVARAALSPQTSPLAAVAGLPDGAARDRALRDIAAFRGDVGRSEIYHWASVAHEIEDNSTLGDVPGAIETAKSKAPGQSGVTLATVAYEAARALTKLRE